MALSQWRQAAIVLCIVGALLAVLLGGNQRYVQAKEETLAGQILCYINSVSGPPIPRFHVDECPVLPPPPPPLPACSNGVDDDGDGLIDWDPTNGDPGCTTPLDTDETDPPPPPPPPGVENTLLLCSDGVDNDGDSLIDLADQNCASFNPKLVVVKKVVNDNGGAAVVGDFALYIFKGATTTVASGATTTVAAGTWRVGEVASPLYTMSVGGDCGPSGEVTLAAGETKTCIVTNDDIAPSPAPACSDGTDNDNDGLIDADDPGCGDAGDTDETDPPVGGGGDSSVPLGGGGGAGGGRAVLGAATTTALITPPVTACGEYLTAFIRFGVTNDSEQVRRLQRVLRDFEGIPLEESGVYDAPTLAAVNAFQLKYAGDILAPWGASVPTGYVYLTTRKKINEIYCNNTQQFSLTAEEARVIEETRERAEAAVALPQTVSAPARIPAESVEAPPALEEVGAARGEETGQTAAVGEAAREVRSRTFWERVLDFLRGR